jgi:hypothetical protein
MRGFAARRQHSSLYRAAKRQPIERNEVPSGKAL